MADGETNACDCYVARHSSARKIDEALIRGDDPRVVAQLYRIGKTRVYEHKKHLAARGNVIATTHAPEAQEPVAAVPNTSPSIVSTEVSTTPVERVERRVEPRGMDEGGEAKQAPETASVTTRALPVPQALPPAPPGGAYVTAVAVVITSITQGLWRASSVDSLVKKYGLSKQTARNAYAEGVRHLQLNMGDYAARQATSAAFVAQERDACKVQSATAKKHAEIWRDRENAAQGEAILLTGDKRAEKLRNAAHFGMLATKYDLSAEKWSAQALAHQRHHDDVLCLRSPSIHATQINMGQARASTQDATAFAAALARRFADRPEILAELDAAAAELEGGAETFDMVAEAA